MKGFAQVERPLETHVKGLREHDRHQSDRQPGNAGCRWNNTGASGDCWRPRWRCGSRTKYREWHRHLKYRRSDGGAGGAGGNGGSNSSRTGGNAGAGGNGGNATASTSTTLNSTAGITSMATATGGAGGNSGIQGNFPNGYYANWGQAANGGDGGTATASAASADSTGVARATATATGGYGGAAKPNIIFSVGGAGGIASNTTASASGFSAYATAIQTGGAGGGGGLRPAGRVPAAHLPTRYAVRRPEARLAFIRPQRAAQAATPNLRTVVRPAQRRRA
jgi:hypothetical protein